MEDNNDVDVTATGRPQTIHARACCRDGDLSLEQIGLVTTVSIVERVLDALDHLVSRL